MRGSMRMEWTSTGPSRKRCSCGAIIGHDFGLYGYHCLWLTETHNWLFKKIYLIVAACDFKENITLEIMRRLQWFALLYYSRGVE